MHQYGGHAVCEGRVILDTPRGVVALDGVSGSQLWAYPWPSWLITAEGGTAVLRIDEREVHLVDTATGRARMSIWGASEIQRGRDGVGIALAGPYLAICGRHPESQRYILRCFDTRDGKRLWTFWHDDPSSTLVLTQTHVVHTCGSLVRAVEAGSGRLCWESSVPGAGSAYGSLVTDGRRVFLAEYNRSTAYDLVTGRVLWNAGRAVAQIDEEVLVGVGSAPRFHAVQTTEAATGKKVGSDREVRLPQSLRNSRPEAIVHCTKDQVVVRVVSGSHYALVCAERGTGRLLWSERRAAVETKVDGGRLYGRHDDLLVCLSTAGSGSGDTADEEQIASRALTGPARPWQGPVPPRRTV